MSSAPPPTDTFTRPQVLSLAAAIACVVTVGIGLSLSIPLLSFALDAKGASRTLIGFNTAMPGVATLVCAPFISGWARRFGMARTLAAAIFVAAASLLAFNAVTPVWAWFPIRFGLGAALTVLFVLSEYWINAAAPESRRGLVLGVYATALSLGFALGPQVLGAVGTTGWPPYLAGAAILLLSGIPIALAGGRAPPIEDKPSAGFLSFFWLVPSQPSRRWSSARRKPPPSRSCRSMARRSGSKPPPPSGSSRPSCWATCCSRFRWASSPTAPTAASSCCSVERPGSSAWQR